MNEDMITLELDDGTSIECEIMGVFDVDGIDYIALANAEGSDDVNLYRYVEIGEEINIVPQLDAMDYTRTVYKLEFIDPYTNERSTIHVAVGECLGAPACKQIGLINAKCQKIYFFYTILFQYSGTSLHCTSRRVNIIN